VPRRFPLVTLVTGAALAATLLSPAVPAGGARAGAQEPAPTAATTPRHPDGGRLFTHGDLVAIGAVTAGTLLLTIWDDDIARWVSDSTVQGQSFIRARALNANYLQETYLTAGGIVMWGVGRLTKSRTTADIGIHVAEAVFVASLASQVIRGPLGRARPSANGGTDQYDFHFGKGFSEFEYRAFPSIHSASGFAAAAVVSNEVRERWPHASWYVTPLAYALGASPGLARVYFGRHWASDIVMGALMGTLAGQKVVSWNHRDPNNRVNRFFLGRAPDERQYNVGITRRF
jgi:membrane-associated phospholipid phosphatase